MFKPFPAFFQGKVRVSAKKSVILHIETPQSSACGGIGRRARLRIWCPTMCRFESCQAHEAGGSFGPPAFVFFQSSLLRRFFLRFAMKASKLDDESCQAHEAGGSFGAACFRVLPAVVPRWGRRCDNRVPPQRGNAYVLLLGAARHPTMCVPRTYVGAPFGRSAAGYTT